MHMGQQGRCGREVSAALDASRSMAHMSLTLHDTYRFNHACAADGSFLPDDADSTKGQAAWAVWHGVGANDDAHGTGGSLPRGSTIADAEMTAVGKCMESADKQWQAGGDPPRLLVLSDCTAVMQDLEAAWSHGSAWRLRGHHRQALLERILG